MTADSTRWARIRSLFEEARELPLAERDAFLYANSSEDLSLRRDVQRLLDADEDEGELEPPAGLAIDALKAVRSNSDAAHQAPSGRQVGPWKLIRRLGRGGMGEVFEAERALGGFEQRAAVKLIASTVPSDEVVARFHREREILASLNHPNIAHLLDGGPSEQGPWLAMELVEGDPILTYCDQRILSIPERLELLVTICEAVHFAHQKLVVHRDLKASNVLVTGEGRAKLLDFGIARILDESASPEPLTRTGFRPMTPEYASPEQIRGEPVSTSSDVYALGVLLYELMTGRRPFDLDGLSPVAVERRVSEGRPARPSSVAPEGLKRRLRGDLDTIILKAMHHDPSQRYDSAAALAADLQRHLTKRPVLARPDTIAYRLSTFARRHRGRLIAAGLLLVAVLVGAGATAYQAQRAATRFENTRQLARSMLVELNAALEDLPGATPVRAMLMSQALTYLDELRQDPGADDALLLEVAEAYAQIASIQGNPYDTNLGNLREARANYERSYAIRSRIFDDQPGSSEAAIALANSLGGLSLVASAEGDLAESTRLALRAREVLAPLDPWSGKSPAAEREAAHIESILGGNAVFAGDFEDGLKTLARAANHQESLAALHPSASDSSAMARSESEPARSDAGADIGLLMALWQTYANQMDGWRFSGQFTEALEVLEEKACPMLEELERDHPNRASIRYALHECYDYVGTLQEHLGIPAAEASYERALETAEGLAELDPQNERGNEAISVALISLGRLMFKEGRVDEGQPTLERARQIRKLMQASNPSNRRWTGLVASVERELCRGLVNNGRPREALPLCAAAIESHRQNVASPGASAISKVTLAYALGHAARANRDVGRTLGSSPEARETWNRALQLYAESLEAYDEAGDFGPDTVWEIHPDSIRSELESLQRQNAPIT